MRCLTRLTRLTRRNNPCIGSRARLGAGASVGGVGTGQVGGGGGSGCAGRGGARGPRDRARAVLPSQQQVLRVQERWLHVQGTKSSDLSFVAFNSHLHCRFPLFLRSLFGIFLEKVCPFQDAKQDYTSLGKFAKLQGSTMLFENGSKCWVNLCLSLLEDWHLHDCVFFVCVFPCTFNFY